MASSNTKFEIIDSYVYYTVNHELFNVSQENSLFNLINFATNDNLRSVGYGTGPETYGKLIKKGDTVYINGSVCKYVCTTKILKTDILEFTEPQTFTLTFDSKISTFMVNEKHALVHVDKKGYTNKPGYRDWYLTNCGSLHKGGLFISKTQLEDKMRVMLKSGLVCDKYDYLTKK